MGLGPQHPEPSLRQSFPSPLWSQFPHLRSGGHQSTPSLGKTALHIRLDGEEGLQAPHCALTRSLTWWDKNMACVCEAGIGLTAGTCLCFLSSGHIEGTSTVEGEA